MRSILTSLSILALGGPALAEPARVAMAAPTIAQTFPARVVTRLPTAEKGGIVCAGGRAP